MNSSGTFDTTYALSSMFLWVTFGYLTTLANCDIQRLVQSHPLAIHAIGLVAFFFLFTLLDSNNSSHISVILLKTLVVYILFVLMTKSKWYFVLPVIALLLIDQAYKKNLAFLKQSGELGADEIAKRDAFQKRITAAINVIVVIAIIVGAAHYAYLQRIEYRERFSWYEFLASVGKCKAVAPDYAALRGGRAKPGKRT